MATRWGIVGAGKISHDFANALGILSESEHKVVAVAARDLSRAQAFADLLGIPKAYGAYEELAKYSEVEVVYIGVLNPWHFPVAKLMLENGKHVLCEKPLGMNLKESSELMKLAKQKCLFLMEGIWSQFFPIYKNIKEEIDSGAIGDIKQIIVSMGRCRLDEKRLTTKALGGGTILTIGVYAIQFAEYIFNNERPLSIKAAGFLNDDGVDESMSAILLFNGNRTATILTHNVVNLPNAALVIGTKGTITVPTFWAPTRVELPSGVVETQLSVGPHPFNYSRSAALRYEAMEVRECLKAGRQESLIVSHANSLLIAEIEDEIRRQVGVVYPQD